MNRQLMAVALGGMLVGATGTKAISALPTSTVSVHDVHLHRDTLSVALEDGGRRGGDGGIKVMVYANQGAARLEPSSCETAAFNRAAEAFFTGAGLECVKPK